jgi:RHS repeat-associated protein
LVSGFVAFGLVASAVVVTAEAVAAAQAEDLPPALEDLKPWSQSDSPDALPVPESEPVPLKESEGVAPMEAAWPEAGTSSVTLGGSGLQVPVDDTGLSIAPETSSGLGAALELRVRGRSVAERAGVTGFVFELSGVSKSVADIGGSSGLPLQISLDYSDIAHAYGSGFADRLRVVALPACALAEEPVPGCRSAGVEVPTRNEASSSRLVADVSDLGGLVSSSGLVVDAAAAEEGPVVSGEEGLATDSAGEPEANAAAVEASADAGGEMAVLAMTSGASGSAEDLAATNLSLTGEWQVSPGSGEFSWSYPMQAPAPPVGLAPDVALSYSSGSIDGMISSENTQAPMNGVGWSDFASAYVERRYTPCSTGDLCWKSWNATLSLNGHSSELIPLDAAHTQWRMKDDPNWKIELSHAGPTNGDHDREYWIVTTPDGTVYNFGYGSNPENTNQKTGSAWTALVLADQPGEPCRGTNPDALAGCEQAWRWNLDYVKSPNGFASTYYYTQEINNYRPIGGFSPEHAHAYVRGGKLDRIEYGKRAGTSWSPAGRVEFVAEYRCNQLSASGCPNPPTHDNGVYFPDVPNDLICSSECLVLNPTFFSSYRYAAVVTSVWAAEPGDTSPSWGWRYVDRWNLSHTFRQNDDGDQKLYLIGIQRVGASNGGLAFLPAVLFWPSELLNNRVDVNSQQPKKMQHYRVGLIIDEFGKQTRITYGIPAGRLCVNGKAGPWENNIQNCFPQKIGSGWGIFHKYVVTQVDEVDMLSGAPTISTTYEYQGDPAWHHDDDEFANPGDQSYSDWRGYGTTRIAVGGSGGHTTMVRVFRGMHNDKLPGGQHRVVQVSSFTNSGNNEMAYDDPHLSGKVFEQIELGPSDATQRGTLYKYIQSQASTWCERRDQNGLPLVCEASDYSRWVGEESVTSTVRGPSGFEQTRVSTEYPNAGLRLPERVIDHGWLSDPNDGTCTQTTYAVNTAKWMLEFPASATMFAGTTCPVNNPPEPLAQSETLYDGSTTVGAAPTVGNPTEQRSLIDTGTWVTTAQIHYDAINRPDSVVDANGAKTTIQHSGGSNGGYPASTLSTTRRGTGTSDPIVAQTATEWLAERNAPYNVIDQNSKETSYRYDDLGRLKTVDVPEEQGISQSSLEYFYILDPSREKLPIVQTRAFQGTGSPDRYKDSWVVYDQFLRERQTQSLSTTSGKAIVTLTGYDQWGQVNLQVPAQAVTGTPGTSVLSPASGGWDNQITIWYDQLGRPTTERAYSRGSAGGALVKKLEKTTSYSFDHTLKLELTDSVTDSPNSPRTITGIDRFGRVGQVRENDATNDADGTGWRNTTYTYDLAGNLASVKDPANNLIGYTYNKVGWRKTMADPDAGNWSYTYTNGGQQATVTDAKNQTTWTGYDKAGRPTERRQNNSGGSLLAEWKYDNSAGGEIGLLDKTIRYTSVGTWTSDITDYDDNYRVRETKLTVPSNLPGLSGDYTLASTYDSTNNPVSTTYPAVGGANGLPAETVTTSYDTLGLPRAMTGSIASSNYVWGTMYDDRARPGIFGYGPLTAQNETWLYKAWTYDLDQRLQTAVTNFGGTESTHGFGYDPLGTITTRTTTQGGQSWRECYQYDTRLRLSAAYTIPSTNTACNPATDQRGTGNQPYNYNYSYAYTVDGNLDLRTETTGAATKTYDHIYPNPGQAHPHAATRITEGATTIDTYTWDDPNGHLTERTVAGQTSTFTWDTERQLTSVATPQGTESYIYDTDGQRLLKTTPTGRTLYFAGHEIKANLAGTTITATRTYSFAGQLVATRTNNQAPKYLGVDQQGSVEASAPGQAAPDVTRAYDPYGKKRSGGEPDTDRGWLGQVEDDTTALNYLNARYYDPNLATFISPDPLYDLAHPKSLNPYAYAWNNPVDNTDPSGKIIQECTTKEVGCGDRGDHKGTQPKPSRRKSKTEKNDHNVSGPDRTPYEQVEHDFNECQYRKCTRLQLWAEDIWLHYVNGMGMPLACNWSLANNMQYAAGAHFCAQAWGPEDGLSEADYAQGYAELTALLGAALLGRPGGNIVGEDMDTVQALRKAAAPCSFDGDTLVLMADGTAQAISEIEVGDEVLATDPDTGDTRPRKVLATLPHVDQLVTLRTSSGEVITTEDHRYWNATDKRWQESEDLDQGDLLLAADGREVVVQGLDWSSIHAGIAYDIAVEAVHSFYAGVGDAAVLVHNCGDEPDMWIDNQQWGKKVGKHAQDWGLDPSDPTARQFVKDHVLAIRGNADEVRLGAWNPSGGGGSDYYFFKQGSDVVVTTGDGGFVTVLKGGETNGWYLDATVLR